MACETSASFIAEKRRTHDLVRLGEIQTEKPNQNIEGETSTPRNGRRDSRRKEVLDLEKQMLRDVLAIKHETRSESRRDVIERAIKKSTPTLDQEQADAVRHLLTGPGIRLMSGIAGSGKTTTMLTCAEVWREEGREVLGLCPGRKGCHEASEGDRDSIGHAGESPLAT